MTAPLPPYGTAHLCAKCGCPDISDSYRAHHPHLVWTGGDLEEIVTPGPTGGECLLRTCRDCGWAWLEACADAGRTGQSARPSGDFTQRLRACPACTASMAACISKGGRCCAMCDHRPADNPMRSSGPAATP